MLFQNYSLVQAKYLFLRCNKTKVTLWNANDTDGNTNRNDVNKQKNTYTHAH